MTKPFLILLTETERSMVEASLSAFLHNPLLEGAMRPPKSHHNEETALLTTIQSFQGGIKKQISEYHLSLVLEALSWYQSFISEKTGRDYALLSVTLGMRSTHRDLFNFDPQNYDPMETKEIETIDYQARRYCLVRRLDDQKAVDYAIELAKNPKESSEAYLLRAKSVLDEKNRLYGLEGRAVYSLIDNSPESVKSLKITPDYKCSVQKFKS